MKSAKTLRLILGDQLNANHSWYRTRSEEVVYLIAELRQETGYVRHHVQKICAFFAAMECFAEALTKAGHRLIHETLDDTADFETLPELLAHWCLQLQVSRLEYQRPDEYRLSLQLENLTVDTDLEILCVESEHFLLPFNDLTKYLNQGRHNRMETFYRKMRKRFKVLMDGDQPQGGSWNYDEKNRNKLKPSDLENLPEPLQFSNDVAAILDRLKRHQVEYFGEAKASIPWPVTRRQAMELLHWFCEVCLPKFGTFQDAMTQNSEHNWSLYHSRLSFALNAKILHPMVVIQTAIESFESSQGTISIAQVEGFVRQILGWREYVRGIYWTHMPDYASKNELEASRALPEYFWNGKTRMNCLRHSLSQSLTHAYAHHIQRLMVIGNFCLLAGIHPDAVDAWYLGVYIDAIEWVEMPNTRGMSQFADGGIIATKPYAASGNYIQNMSDYCNGCHYQVKEKLGEKACPLNSLYWHFMYRHRQRFSSNPRIGFAYKTWERMSAPVQHQILKKAEKILEDLETL